MKINGQSDEMLRAAAEQFGSKAEDEIAHGKQNCILYSNCFTLDIKETNAELVYRIQSNFLVAKETLEGHQRAMMGNMTVEEIYRERKTFSNAVFDVSKKDFVKFGMSIISYTLKDITDEVGYLKVSGV